MTPLTPTLTAPGPVAAPASEIPLLGYILSASLPKMRVPVAALHELAATTGYPTSYLPEARSAKPAFERATTEATGGAQGMVVSCPQEVAEEIQARFGARPTLRLRLATIQRGQGKEICPTRHLVGEIIVPPAGDVAEQRKETTVARFTLKGGTIEVERFPMRAFPREVLDPVIGQVQADFAAFCAEVVDENALRAGLRDYLADLFGLMGNPRLGVYFIPVTASGAEEKLRGIQAFIQGLQTYVADSSQLYATCAIYPVADLADDPFSNRHGLRVDAGAAISTQIDDLSERLQKLPEKKGRTREKAIKQTQADLLRLRDQTLAYQQALRVQFEDVGTAVQHLLTHFQQFINR